LRKLDLRGTSLANALVDELPEEPGTGIGFSTITPTHDSFGNTWISVRWS
jgi:hypothetical protein